MDSREIIALLVEIRDLQRAHLEEYQRVTQESLELARRSVLRQEQFARLYRGVLVVGALVLIGLGVFVAFLVRGFR
jgi:CHASE3 domain sensor protein